jgi:hypothetical protein
MVHNPIQRLAARLEQAIRNGGQGVCLAAEEVHTALDVLRSRRNLSSCVSEDRLYRVERIGADGVIAELAVVSDPVVARAAYDAALQTTAGKLVLRRGAKELCSATSS